MSNSLDITIVKFKVKQIDSPQTVFKKEWHLRGRWEYKQVLARIKRNFSSYNELNFIEGTLEISNSIKIL